VDCRSGRYRYRREIHWQARGLVNATGPWVKQFFDEGMHLRSPYGIRLIKGSHIVVPRVHTQKQAYILQNEDKRIVFVIPWMDVLDHRHHRR
jgi:glycerol-3-phosphate dehydrogenase